MKKILFSLILLTISNTAFAGKTVCEAHLWGWDPDLLFNKSPIPGYNVRVTVNRPSRLVMQGHIDFRQKFIQYGIGIGVVIEVKKPGSLGFEQIHGSETGANTTNSGSDPYYTAQIHGYMATLQPGVYDFRVMANAYAAAEHLTEVYGVDEVDGLAEVKGVGHYNQVLFQVEDLDSSFSDNPAACSTF